MKIAIAGYGVEGQASYRYFSRLPDAELTIVDESAAPKFEVPAGAKTLLGPGVFGQLQGFDLVVRTPSIPPDHIQTDGKRWSATNEFFEKCPAPIIGVTGTKGKGTTSSMIASILEASGKKVWLVGNIGTAALDVLDQVRPDHIVVYELSSFQLWDMERSPQVAAILGIEPEHLDVHKDFADYLAAKGNIHKFQQAGDTCVYLAANEYTAQIATKPEVDGLISLPYGLAERQGAHVYEDAFYVSEEIICSTGEVQLRGEHNLENACAAVGVAHALGVSNDAIAEGLRNFKGLPDRLEYVATIDSVQYINDSFSSSTPATVAAVRAFSEPEIVIVGGIDRGGDFEHLANEVKAQTNIKEWVVIGEIRHKLAEALQAAGVPGKVTVLDATTMREIVAYAAGQAVSGNVVILSPGCASFDLFRDFYDRGNQFRQEVQALARRGDAFVFDHYEFEPSSGTARFFYHFVREGEKLEEFSEKITFDAPSDPYDSEVLDRALRLAFLLVGTSYYKAFPATKVQLPWALTAEQANFLNHVYQEGLSQFAFENHLTRGDLAQFEASEAIEETPPTYAPRGVLALQSGGKDSLLTATLLAEQGKPFTPWYLTSSDYHPHILDELGTPLVAARRAIDLATLQEVAAHGARNGHVPITYIVQSLALIQAILLGKNEVLVSIAHEGEEPHATIGDLSVTHQWSKTWEAEQLFANYVHQYVSSDLEVGSPLRQYSELRVAELFREKAWQKFGAHFSSCNRANYRQAADNSELHWCGDCPKCANSYLLFAPFVPADELQALFAGQDLFAKPSLEQTFKGLLGIDGIMKPFECVGQTDELRYAYGLAQAKGYGALPFEVPAAEFDYLFEYPSQAFAHLLQ